MPYHFLIAVLHQWLQASRSWTGKLWISICWELCPSTYSAFSITDATPYTRPVCCAYQAHAICPNCRLEKFFGSHFCSTGMLSPFQPFYFFYTSLNAFKFLVQYTQPFFKKYLCENNLVTTIKINFYFHCFTRTRCHAHQNFNRYQMSGLSKM